MALRIRVICETTGSSVIVADPMGKSLLNSLGRTYEGYLARGEGAQIIKALSKLSKEDNTGTITLVPKLYNYLVRNITERLAHFAYKMNQTNDKVESQRWGKNGLKLTDELLASSTAHAEVAVLGELLGVLAAASKKYANVVFIREDEAEPVQLGGCEDYEEDDFDDGRGSDDEEEEEEDEPAPVAAMPTSQRRTLADAKSMVTLIKQRAAERTSVEQTIILPLESFMEDAELANWENKPDKTLLINSLQASLAGTGQTPESQVPVLRNLTFAEIQEYKLASASNMFALEQPAGNTVGKIVELILDRARNSCPLKVETFVRVQNFMTLEEIETYSGEMDKVQLAVLAKLRIIWDEENEMVTYWNSCSLRGYDGAEQGELFVLEQLGELERIGDDVSPWPVNDQTV